MSYATIRHKHTGSILTALSPHQLVLTAEELVQNTADTHRLLCMHLQQVNYWLTIFATVHSLLLENVGFENDGNTFLNAFEMYENE